MQKKQKLKTTAAVKTSMIHKTLTIFAVIVITLAVVNNAYYWHLRSDVGGVALGTTPQVTMTPTHSLYYLECNGENEGKQINVVMDTWVSMLYLDFFAKMMLLAGLSAILYLILSQLHLHYVKRLADKSNRGRNLRIVLCAMIIFAATFALATKELALGPNGAVTKMKASLHAHNEILSD